MRFADKSNLFEIVNQFPDAFLRRNTTPENQNAYFFIQNYLEKMFALKRKFGLLH